MTADAKEEQANLAVSQKSVEELNEKSNEKRKETSKEKIKVKRCWNVERCKNILPKNWYSWECPKCVEKANKKVMPIHHEKMVAITKIATSPKSSKASLTKPHYKVGATAATATTTTTTTTSKTAHYKHNDDEDDDDTPLVAYMSKNKKKSTDFECDEKFWEITLDQESFTTRWGKIGHKDRTNTKIFGTREKMEKAAETLIKSKIKKGYEETSSN